MMKKSLLLLTIPALCACNNEDEPNNNPPATGPHTISVAVLDFSPAPGQFVNEMPAYKDGDTDAAMRTKAEELINDGRLVSLGSLGGSITLQLSKPIMRSLDGTPEFFVSGNAFLKSAEDVERPYGSAEPGLVYVMDDVNGNNLPDDTWYLLRGDYYEDAVLTTVTYTDNSAAQDDQRFVLWSDNHGNSGALSRYVSLHDHAFFPQWRENTSSYTVTALRLPDNGFFNPLFKEYTLYAYCGYADTWNDAHANARLSLSNAVDADGKPAMVQKVNFIRIVTGVLQDNGIIGECSTEVGGIIAL